MSGLFGSNVRKAPPDLRIPNSTEGYTRLLGRNIATEKQMVKLRKTSKFEEPDRGCYCLDSKEQTGAFAV